MVKIPDKNFMLLAGEALIGCLAITYGMAYGAYKLFDKYVLSKK